MGNEKKMFRKIIANEIMKIYIDIKKTHIQQFTHARYLLHELMIIRRNISADLFFLKKKIKVRDLKRDISRSFVVHLNDNSMIISLRYLRMRI